MSIEFLRDHSSHLRKFASATESRAKANPQDFWAQVAASNQSDAAADAEREYALALALQAGELVDFRFVGPAATGSISLDSFLKIFEPLSRTIKLAAQRLRYGTDEGRIQQDISDILNLRLAGLSPGSTHIYITANAHPDLAGENLFENTLTQIFRVLRTSDDDFFDAVDAIGGRAAVHLKEALGAISSAGFAADWRWQTKRHLEHWEGRPAELDRVRTLLGGLSEPDTYDEVLTGTVSGLADTGRLVLRTHEGKAIVRFPLAKTSDVQRLKIAGNAKIKVRTTSYHDELRKVEVFKRILVDVL